MSLFSENLKYLRIRKDVSQQVVADAIAIPRPRYAKYEDGKNFPPPDTLLALSRYFAMSIDLLLSVDVRKIPVGDLLKLENNRLLLPITVDSHGNNLIEVVTEKARAGYLNGYADPEYIENLQQVALPFLGPGKHRGFPVEGDSMPPHEPGSIIVGRYVERLGDVMDGRTYILITRNGGIVYKRLNRNRKNVLVLESDNGFYPPYEVPVSDILEIWEYECSIGRSDRKPAPAGDGDLRGMLMELKRDMEDVRKRLG
ncbi:XRE family transcriptional regulator [Flavobacterium soli]|uniref:XRE family transcriptional regulator n=1 Tax=Flavobacterium soli TaxID=344881 RepID=UPI0009FF03F1|nr:LexA family transcriptional regulator [Flavobacterium soli]